VIRARFPVLSGGGVPNRASPVVGLAARRLPDGREQAHGVRSALAHAFVDQSRWNDACAAAGWSLAGTMAPVEDCEAHQIG